MSRNTTNIKTQSLTSILVATLMFSFVQIPVFAQGTSSGSPELDVLLNRVINLLSMAVGLVVVISIIVAGVQYMTAGGNASQVAAAKGRISMAILALILFFLTYSLLQWLVPGGIF